MRLFALRETGRLGGDVARILGVELDPHEERDFEDGEHKARPLVSVRGEDVYVIQSLAGEAGASPNDKLLKLLFYVATCRENGAARVTAITPYLAYARKERQTKARDPVSTRYVAQLFEAVGTDCLVTLDVHNFAAFQNAFRCRTVHLDTGALFPTALRELAGAEPIVMFSPDGGGVKRAQLLKERCEAAMSNEVGFGFMEKRRSRGVVSGDLFAGEVNGKVVFLVDDMISTGGTMIRAAHACRERGAKEVHAIATHGLFSRGAEALFTDTAIGRVVATDSVGSPSKVTSGHEAKLQILSIAPLIAEAIKRLHVNGSISELAGMER
ncbi:ribose-phosphate diphosphokinase [Mesorhizobium erdmanii]|uniref:ribose-phosphate diphosphokinase n=1 Tax=Mesorhizobium erdmanii TaxID=1777866 RepID=A0A6M7UFF6_9HYPH|nr:MULTISPECIES: ribose-phosphate pyrophosphokinase [Mesorhizobium]OBQ57815.1 ribose-phosphate pyrophosphokinase [Mesorhizobium loti]QKC75592.1 ribose-phosphate pyrophosphokinase [Mesorhizobium erdmanii]